MTYIAGKVNTCQGRGGEGSPKETASRRLACRREATIPSQRKGKNFRRTSAKGRGGGLRGETSMRSPPRTHKGENAPDRGISFREKKGKKILYNELGLLSAPAREGKAMLRAKKKKGDPDRRRASPISRSSPREGSSTMQSTRGRKGRRWKAPTLSKTKGRSSPSSRRERGELTLTSILHPGRKRKKRGKEATSLRRGPQGLCLHSLHLRIRRRRGRHP